MSAPALSDHASKCLAALAKLYRDEYGFIPFKIIADESGVPLIHVRRTVRFLARKGLAEYAKGLWTDDGRPAGAGYRCTDAGLDFAARASQRG